MISSPLAARILLVEDDRKLARLLVDLLRAHGHAALAVHDGHAGIERAREERWDLVVLDVMLPGIDGFDVLRRLRRVSQVPVLMLTARGSDADRVAGLDGGADDYVAKTASSRELVARIGALLRRVAIAPPARTAQVLAAGDLHLDLDARAASLGERRLSLTPVELDLLIALLRFRGRVRSREQLLEQVRGRELGAFDRSIDVHIAALRRKLGDDPRAPRYIRTVRSAGYMLVDPAEAPS
ncbi:MAG TPA: response regulator transcription factor [Burkholderiaceae bacterium]|nr:response regulator transcription factor [Burkholderiaceae bacterium]